MAHPKGGDVMVNIANCETDSSKFSTRGLRAIEDIRSVVKSSNTLIKITGLSLFDIFFNSSQPHEKVIGVASYDWDEFAKIMKGIPEITRRRVYDIATMEALYSYGEEAEFWGCVSEATR